MPALSDAVAWLDCIVAHTYPGGDHTIFVGEVTEAATPRVTSPLLFHSRTWGQVADPLPAAIHLTVDVAPGDPLARALRSAGSRVRGDAGHTEFLVDADPPAPERVAAAKRSGPVVAYLADAFDPARGSATRSTLLANSRCPDRSTRPRSSTAATSPRSGSDHRWPTDSPANASSTT